MKEEIQFCPTCGHIISQREISLYKGIMITLWKVFAWCKKNNRHEFERKDIKHLFTTENDTARFGDLVLFGGLVYKNKKASYGLNIERCEQFFLNKIKIPTRGWKDPMTGKISFEDERSLSDFPELKNLLDEDQMYISNYRESRIPELKNLFS